MNSKRSPRPAEGEPAEGADEDSIDASLNKLLSEAEAADAPKGAPEPSIDVDIAEITSQGDDDGDADAPPAAATPEGAAASAAPAAEPSASDSPKPEPPAAEPSAAEASAAEPAIEASASAGAEAPAMDAPAAPAEAEGVPVVHTAEAEASMSGPSLVDDVKEEHTDVEPPEVIVEVDAAAQRDELVIEDATIEPPGTPVREEVTDNLGLAAARGEEITTAPGDRVSDDVITAENLGSLEAAKRSVGAPSASDLPTPAYGRLSSLADQSREERDRALGRARPDTPATPLPRLREPARSPAEVATDDLNDVELEMAALDYDHHRRSPAGGLDAGARRPVTEPWATPGADPAAPRATPGPRPSTGNTGRHATLPPPTTAAGAATGPTTGRHRLPTPRPIATPSPRRTTGQSLPVTASTVGSGAHGAVRTTSAVFNKVQLPLGGLVTVVGAAFGVGLIIGAVLWRGSGESTPDQASHEAKAPAAPSASAPAPAAVGAANPPAPVPAAEPAATPTPATPPAPPPAEATAAEHHPPVRPMPKMTVAAPPAHPPVAARKVATSVPKPVRTKKPVAGKSESGGKGKGAAWVDPFAQ